jgi:hypothetical protein
MKRIITLLFIVFVSYSKAQITFPATGADWHYLVQNGGFGGPTNYSNTEVKYIKDTLFMGKPAHVLGTNISNFITPGFSSDNIFVYTSNDSVYFYNSKTNNQWQLLYSFGTSIGQSWQTYLQDQNGVDTINVKVDSVKYTVINSVSLKTLFVTYTEINHPNYPHIYHSVIYDRIGDVNYLFNFFPDVFALCDGCSIIQGLLCYSDSTLGLYQPDTSKACNYSTSINKLKNINDELKVYPNPSNGIFQVTASGNIDELKVTDILGQSVYEAKPHATNTTIEIANAGVYFISITSGKETSIKKVVVTK